MRFSKGSPHSVRFTVVSADAVDHEPLVLPGFVMDQETFLATEAGYDFVWEFDDLPTLEMSFTCYTIGSGKAEDPDFDELKWLTDHLPDFGDDAESGASGWFDEAEHAASGWFYVNNPFYFNPEEG